MPPNTSSVNENLNTKKKNQKENVTLISRKKNKNLDLPVRKLTETHRITLGILILACILATFSPNLFNQIVQYKRWFKNKNINFNTQNVQTAANQRIDHETGIIYEYHQFMATVEQNFSNISLHEVKCNYKGYPREILRGAAPRQCGTLIYDELVHPNTLHRLREMSKLYTTQIGDTNYHNRESYNLKWINLHHLFKYGAQDKIFDDNDFELIRNTSEAVKNTVCSTFGLPKNRVYFSPVSQFTRYKPVVPFQEFRHVDKVRSPYLIVTTILWLSTVDIDFGGGRTEFLTGGPEPFTPLLIEPKFGRFAAWTSGWENPHGVMEVEHGERLALIFAFTVHDDIGHPNMESLREWALREIPDRKPTEQISRSDIKSY